MLDILKIFCYTVKTAFFSTVIAVLIGVVCSYFTSHKKFIGRKFLLSLSTVPLCVPSLIVALGYVSFFGVNGIVNSLFNTSFSFLYSSVGLILAQGFYNFPLILGIVNDAWELIPKQNEDAARILGASEKRVFFTITLKQLSGAIGAACIPVFLFCFFSFMIVLLFSPAGNTTLEVEIYYAIRSTLKIDSAIVLALIETVSALSIVLLYFFIFRKNQVYNSGLNFEKREKTKIKSVKEKVIFSCLIMLILVFFIGPFFSIVENAFTHKQNGSKLFSFSNFQSLFASEKFVSAFFNSIKTGLCTAFFCTLVAFVYAFCIRINNQQKNMFYSILPYIPMAISSVIISWVITLIFHESKVWLFILIQVLLYWPIAYRQIQNGMNRITEETKNASRMLSKNKFYELINIYFPSCKKVIVTAFLYSFAISIGDATMPLILSIKNFNTIALYTYQLADRYKFNSSCACGLILCVICVLLTSFRKKS